MFGSSHKNSVVVVIILWLILGTFLHTTSSSTIVDENDDGNNGNGEKDKIILSSSSSSSSSSSPHSTVSSSDISSGPQQKQEQQHRVVHISYQDLLNAFQEGNGSNDDSVIKMTKNEEDDDVDHRRHHLSSVIADAFGPTGLGFLEITNIPSRMVELRRRVLPMAEQLAHLPSEELDTLTRPDQDYTIGWSHGKEQFGINATTGLPIYDTRKGSFYFDPYQPQNNVFPNVSFETTTIAETESNDDGLQHMEEYLLEVTRSMTQIALWVSKLSDIRLKEKTTCTTEEEKDTIETTTSSSSSSSGGSTIYESLKSCVSTKARLLYYFPVQKETSSSSSSSSSKQALNESSDNTQSDDDWCGWHKDHGSFTALLPGMIFSTTKESYGAKQRPRNPTDDLTASSSQKPGLYIQTRDGSQILVQIPSTSIGIQVGETVEIMSGGKFVATPHAVMSKGVPMGGRASLAVFLQPELHQVLPSCPDTADVSLQNRYRTTFGAFQDATTKSFQ